MKPVFDGAQQSRRVRSGHSKPALFSQNPRFWFNSTVFPAGGRDIRFPPPPFVTRYQTTSYSRRWAVRELFSDLQPLDPQRNRLE